MQANRDTIGSREESSVRAEGGFSVVNLFLKKYFWVSNYLILIKYSKNNLRIIGRRRMSVGANESHVSSNLHVIYTGGPQNYTYT